MKKVGIVTIHKINNYGAVEQAYALNRYLRDKGYDVRTIDFRTYRVAESYQIFSSAKSVMGLVRNFQSLIYRNKLLKRKQRFDEFLKKNVPMTQKAYYSNEELQQAELDFDYYICGSDQIWNTYCRNYDDAFILSFAKDKGKRIAYAASMGRDSINEDLQQKFHDELKDYSAISVRESNAVEVISKISEKEVSHVVDPVFLLEEEEWRKVAAERQIKGPYIFFYSVHGDLPGMRDYVKKLGEELKLPIVVVNMNLREMKYKNVKMYDAGPSEFLSLIANAEYVCTNSFHACAFSIIFRKKFLVFTDTAKDSSSSRIYSILNSCGLAERVASENCTAENMKKEINYDAVYTKLRPKIQYSKDFLLKALDCQVD